MRSEHEREWNAAVFHWERALEGKSEIRNPKSETSVKARLAYARQAGAVIQQAIAEERPRWSGVLLRQPWAAPEMLDLGSFYTVALDRAASSIPSEVSFRELPSGVQTLGGVGFDLRGIIDLGRARQVSLTVNRPCRYLHFLHASNREASGLREIVGNYQVTYANGQNTNVSLVDPQDLPAYCPTKFIRSFKGPWTGTSPDLSSLPAWAGCSPSAARGNQPLFLTRTTWRLPAAQAGIVVRSLELQAGPSSSAPLVFAITVE